MANVKMAKNSLIFMVVFDFKDLGLGVWMVVRVRMVFLAGELYKIVSYLLINKVIVIV